jgi:hypothetical protein
MGRIAPPCLLLLLLAFLPGAAQGAATTRHLPSDAAADAAVAAGGGSYRFATEAKAGQPGSSDWELAMRRRPTPVDGSQVTAQFDRWAKDAPVLFTLTYAPPLRRVIMTLTRGATTAVVFNRSSHDVVGDFTDLFVRAVSTRGNSCVSVANLFLDGLPVGDRAEAWHGGGQGCRPPGGDDEDDPGDHDLLQISGANLADGFLLAGTITFRWQGGRAPRGDEMDVQIWGAAIGGAPPPDTTPPSVAFSSPADGALLATATPAIAADYSDGGSGIDPASVSLLVDGTDRTAEATITASGLTLTPGEPLAEGAHTATLSVADLAGNAATANVFFTTDSIAPTIVAVASPEPNTADWNNSDVTVSFDCADVGSGVASCSGPVTVTSEGAGQEVTGTAVDLAGNSTTASVVVNLDKTAPSLAVSSPLDGSTLGVTEAVLAGTADSGVAPLGSLLCAGTLANLEATAWTCTVSLELGLQSLLIEAIDLAGNAASATLTLTVADPIAFSATIASPGPNLVTAAASVVVMGTANGPIAAVAINGAPADFALATFEAEVPLVEGTNRLVATVEGAGGATATAAVTVRRDTQPPFLVIESPPDGARLIEDRVTLSGTVNDVIPGVTVNADDVSVTVNGQPAAVLNRSFTFPDLPLALGTNTVEVTAVDRAGNSRSSTIEVEREPDLAGIRLVVVSGNNQDAPVGGQLPLPLVVRIETLDGQILPGRPVEFAVSNGDGRLGDPADDLRQIAVLADEAGEATVNFRVGSRTGEGLHRVRVTTPGSLTAVEFCATGNFGVAQKIAIARMTPRRALAGEKANDPLAVIVTDGFGNPVPGAAVTFQVEFGGGKVNGLGATMVPTNADGIAEVDFTLGPAAGRANNRVSATFAGYGGLPAVFVLSGVAPGAPENTAISGIVQNSVGEPIVGARAVLEATGQETTTATDGRFLLSGVPPGGHLVAVHAGTADDPGAGVFYPSIELAIDAFPGIENPLDQVLVLPFLDPTSARLVGGEEDVELGMQGVPGFKIKIRAHSTIRRDGTRGPVMMSSSQVKLDKMPMPAPQGSTPLVVGTLQPGGIHFDPPAEVTYPNPSGLAPGDVADLFAFHHDIGQFVNIGPGTVSDDGRVIASNPGFGIVQSGWHGVFRDPGDDGEGANDCHGDVEWQVDGQLETELPILLFVDEETGQASADVRVNFTPGGGSFNSSTWSGGNAQILRSNDAAGGNVATVTVTAMDLGATDLVTPEYLVTGSGGQQRPSRATAPAVAVKVEVEIFDTPAQNDDVVRVRSTIPVKRHTIVSRIRVLGNPPRDVTAVITNPDGRLRFPAAANTTRTVTLPKAGTWVRFEVSGQTASAAKDDAKIEVRCNSATGPVCGKEDMTVFSIGDLGFTAVPGANYALLTNATQFIYQPSGGQGIDFTYEGTLKPAGLDCGVVQIRDLRIGMIQNLLSSVRKLVYDSPTIVWDAGVASGTQVIAPKTIAITLRLAGPLDDSTTASAPLYDRSAGALTVPLGCTGGAAGATRDSPQTGNSLTISMVGNTAAGVRAGVLTYTFKKTTFADPFRSWPVCFDTVTSEVLPLRQVSWALRADSSATTPQRATAGTPAAPTLVPVDVPPYPNDAAMDPANQAIGPEGTATQTFRKP